MVAKEEIATAGSYRPQQADAKKSRQRSLRGTAGRHAFTIRIESLRQILRADEQGEQHAGAFGMAEQRAQCYGFGNEIEQHGHELRLASLTSTDNGIEDTTNQSSGAEGDGKLGWRKSRHSLGRQCERDGRDQNTATEGHDSMDDLAFALGFGAPLKPCQNAANESGDACEPGNDRYDCKLSHDFPLSFEGIGLLRFLAPSIVARAANKAAKPGLAQ